MDDHNLLNLLAFVGLFVLLDAVPGAKDSEEFGEAMEMMFKEYRDIITLTDEEIMSSGWEGAPLLAIIVAEIRANMDKWNIPDEILDKK